MVKNFWQIVNKVIDDADVLLLLLDARLVEETRNREIEKKVALSKKPLIYVVTKCDLVGKDVAEKYKKTLNPCVFVSAKEFHGTTKLRDRILIEANKAKVPYKAIRVGVLGYPNVGKSSLINSMKGKKSASTSILSGHTKGVQKIKADNRILFLDTPGVIPYKENDRVKHAFIGTLDFTKAKDPDLIIIDLMNKFPNIVEHYYDVEVREDKEETIEEIAKKRNILKKGGEADVIRMGRMILCDWQKGNIK